MKRFACILMTLALSFQVGPIRTAASTDTSALDLSTVTYNAGNFSTYRDRTVYDVAKEYASALAAGVTDGEGSYVDGEVSSYYTSLPSFVNPYFKGEVSDQTLSAMVGMANFYRYLVGSTPWEDNLTNDASLQAQALDRNFEFEHHISQDSKPEDMDEETWAEGFECKNNIICSGSTPKGAIHSFMNEGYQIESDGSSDWMDVGIGHRLVVLSDVYSKVQFAYCGPAVEGEDSPYGPVAAGRIDAESETETMTDPFWAFPAAGYMPEELIEPENCVWNVYLNSNYLHLPEDISDITVTIYNVNTKESFVRTLANDGIKAADQVLQFVQPEDYQGDYYTDSYQVKIEGLVDDNQESASLGYQVDFFPVADYTPSQVNSVDVENRIYQIPESNSSSQTLSMIASTLPDQVTCIMETGKEVEVSVEGNWSVDESKQCFVNNVSEESLPDIFTDPKGIATNLSVPYTIVSSGSNLYNEFKVNGDENNSGIYLDGSTLYMSMYLPVQSTENVSEIYQFIEGDGSYTANLWAGSNLLSRNETAINYMREAFANGYDLPAICFHGFAKKANFEDNGTYLSMYHIPGKSLEDQVVYHVSTESVKVQIANHNYTTQIVEPVDCMEPGYTIYICENCGHTYIGDYVYADHVAGEWQVDVEATYEHVGIRRKYCTVCGKQLEEETIPKLKESPSVNEEETEEETTTSKKIVETETTSSVISLGEEETTTDAPGETGEEETTTDASGETGEEETTTKISGSTEEETTAKSSENTDEEETTTDDSTSPGQEETSDKAYSEEESTTPAGSSQEEESTRPAGSSQEEESTTSAGSSQEEESTTSVRSNQEEKSTEQESQTQASSNRYESKSQEQSALVNSENSTSSEEQALAKSLLSGKKIEYKGMNLILQKDGGLCYLGPVNKSKSSSLTVPDSVEMNGKTYQITSIGDGAFSQLKNLKKMVIGKNVKTIGKKAFYGCKSLKTIIIKTKKLKKVGKNAFKKIYKKVKITLPKKKYKKYKKLLVKAEVKKTAKWKKK